MPRRILQVTPYFPPDFEFGGPVRLVDELSRALSTDFDVTVFTYQHYLNRAVHDDSAVLVKRFSPFSRMLSRRFNFYYSQSLIRALKQNISQFDLVHTHDYRSFHNSNLARLCAQHNIPLVLSSYNSINPNTGQSRFKKIFDSLYGREILKRVNQFVAVNEFEKEDIMKYGVSEDRITIIPNGVDIRISDSTHSIFRSHHNISESAQLILFFSRLHSYKRPDLAVAAFAQIISQHPAAVLVLYGPDGGELESIQKQITRLGISESVRLIPETAGEHKEEIYTSADILIVPSPHNEFPLVLLEALAYGLPIVTAERSIAHYIHQQAGEVTEPTAEALADAMQRIITQPELAQRYKQAGPQIYQEHFTMQKYTERISKLYTTLIG